MSEPLVQIAESTLVGRDYDASLQRILAVESDGALKVGLKNKQTPITPTGVLLGTTETTVYTAPAGKVARLSVAFNNVAGAPRTLNAWVYTGAGPGTNATRLVALNVSLASGTSLVVEDIVLPGGYSVTATSSVASEINAMPMGFEE